DTLPEVERNLVRHGTARYDKTASFENRLQTSRWLGRPVGTLRKVKPRRVWIVEVVPPGELSGSEQIVPAGQQNLLVFDRWAAVSDPRSGRRLPRPLSLHGAPPGAIAARRNGRRRFASRRAGQPSSSPRAG